MASVPTTAIRLPAGSKFGSQSAAWNDMPRKSLRPAKSGIHGANKGRWVAMTIRHRNVLPARVFRVQVSVPSSNTEPMTSWPGRSRSASAAGQSSPCSRGALSRITKSVTPAASSSSPILRPAVPAPITTMCAVTETWCASSRSARWGPAAPPRSKMLPAGRSRPCAPRAGAGCCAPTCVPAVRPGPPARRGSGC